MRRCLQLAAKGAGHTAPNPLVGAVLVCNGRIIGEGWHRQYGGPHAEVNCLQSVQEADRPLINQSTLYISLEPCNHTGKTPPCTELIIRHQIPSVVVGCTDLFAQVNGKGIARLREAGIQVNAGVLEADCKHINRRFFTFHQQQRPYVILKWAQTANGIMGSGTDERLLISNELTNRLVHRWRSEEAAVLVGSRTALLDNPQLDNRLWTGALPVRVVLDRQLKLPGHLHIFNGKQDTVILNEMKDEDGERLRLLKLPAGEHIAGRILKALYDIKLMSVLVEGGPTLLEQFISAGLWDEARVITNTGISAAGLEAPGLPDAVPAETSVITGDRIDVFYNPKTSGL